MYLAANYHNNTTHIARRITVFPHYSIRHTTQLIRCLQHVSTAQAPAAPEMPRTTSFTSHHRALVYTRQYIQRQTLAQIGTLCHLLSGGERLLHGAGADALSELLVDLPQLLCEHVPVLRRHDHRDLGPQHAHVVLLEDLQKTGKKSTQMEDKKNTAKADGK